MIVDVAPPAVILVRLAATVVEVVLNTVNEALAVFEVPVAVIVLEPSVASEGIVTDVENVFPETVNVPILPECPPIVIPPVSPLLK